MKAFPRNAEGVDFSGSPIVQLGRGVFPDWWCFVPVAGKATYVKEWTTKPLPSEKLLEEYKSKTSYRGLGVVTGEFSGGLLAVDIDGEQADERYRQEAGDAYEARGEETTMSWTSGKPGRRQILYRIPASLVPELRHVKTVILRMDGEWHLGKGDSMRGPGGKQEQPETELGEGKYQEVVLRFNHCQSVVPGSPHPETHKLYQWLNYNNGQVELAPEWILSVLRPFRMPVQWLSDADQKALDAELGETAVPSRQIRGWFFKEEVQRLLMPRLEDLVFKHEVFDNYGWKTREGSNPQRMSGCPWHGGDSGTAFQYAMQTGCWDCKACGIGGDVLDFIHKTRSNDMHATRPQGPDLEAYVAEIATALGFDYPACAKSVEVVNKEAPLRRMSGPEFFEAAQKIVDAYDNSELAHYQLMELVRDAGLGQMYRSGPQVEAALERFLYNQTQDDDDENWQARARGQREYLIPDFMSKPSSVMLHARGGLGKTRLAVLLSRIVGRKEPIKVRGLMVQPTVSGNVLFIGNDMSPTDYAEYLDQQGIDSSGEDRWFKFKPQWQQTQYRVLVRWLQEYKPVLVVVDSLTSASTMVAAKEYEKEYANTLYRLARENGTAFPATTFLWIHHNTKDGTKFRGSDTLRNAVHETWELKELTDQEKAEYGTNALILQIEKCRGQRSGDRFLIREDIEEALSIEDLTPTVSRDNNGLGDEKPRTVLLGLLKDAKEPLTQKELRWQLNERLNGVRGSMVSKPTVWRWLQAWISSGLVEPVEVRQAGQKGGRPAMAFRVVSPIYLPQDETNPPSYFETSSAAIDSEDEVCFTGMKQTPSKQTPEYNSSVVSHETENEAEEAVDPPNEVTSRGTPEVDSTGEGGLIHLDQKNAVKQTSSPETRSSTGIPEDEGEVCFTPRQIYGGDAPDWNEGGWDSVDWG